MNSQEAHKETLLKIKTVIGLQSVKKKREEKAYLKYKQKNGDPITRQGWSQEEQEMLIDAIRDHGKNWKKITEIVGTRDKNAVCSYAFGLRTKLMNNPTMYGQDILPILQSNNRCKD